MTRPAVSSLAEISRVRKDMYNDTLNGSAEKRSSELPDAVGPVVQLQEKLYVPVKEYPDVSIVLTGEEQGFGWKAWPWGGWHDSDKNGRGFGRSSWSSGWGRERGGVMQIVTKPQLKTADPGQFAAG